MASEDTPFFGTQVVLAVLLALTFLFVGFGTRQGQLEQQQNRIQQQQQPSEELQPNTSQPKPKPKPKPKKEKQTEPVFAFPSHFLNGTVSTFALPLDQIETLFEEVFKLRRFVRTSDRRNRAVKSFPTIGEDLSIGSQSECPDPLLEKTFGDSICHFSDRADIAQAYLVPKEKSRWWKREDSKDRLRSRLFSFAEYPSTEELTTPKSALAQLIFGDLSETATKDKSLLYHMSNACPSTLPYVDLMSVMLDVRLPGQVTPMHLDVPYFTTANRHHFPPWLLVAMSMSGFFEEEAIDHVVSRVHLAGATGAVSSYQTSHTLLRVPHTPGRVAVFDGRRVFSSTTLPDFPVKQNAEKHRRLLEEAMKTKSDVRLHFEEDQWILTIDDQHRFSYDEKEIDFSLVTRGRCTANLEAAKALRRSSHQASLMEILQKLRPATSQSLNRLDIGREILKRVVYPKEN